MKPNTVAIAIFAFNRPRHLRETLNALLQCSGASELPIYFFCDGPRTSEDERLTKDVRSVIKNEDRFIDKRIFTEEVNLGLAKSIINGVTKVLNDFEQIIVLEDDIVVSPAFLEFMLDGLRIYRSDSKVASLCGYMYPISTDGLQESFFLRGADCWGWATWRRGWLAFEQDGTKLLAEIESKGLAWDFDVNGSYPFLRMLKDQIRGKNNSWAIRWQAVNYLKDRMTLYPSRTLVTNIGFDGSGTHCVNERNNLSSEVIRTEPIKKFPDYISHDAVAYSRIGDFLASQRSWRFRLLRRILLSLRRTRMWVQ